MYDGIGRMSGRNKLSSPTNSPSRDEARGFVESQKRKTLRILAANDGVMSGKLATHLRDLLHDKHACHFKSALDSLAKSGGQAAGPDRIQPRDLSQSERWKLAKDLRRRIFERKYQPGVTRTVWIPKGPGRGERKIQIQNVEDRAVQRAILEIVQPVIDPTFDRCSFGFRPGIDRRHALATALAIATRDSAWVWILADIKDAFEQTNHQRLLENLESRLPVPEILEVIATVIKRRTGRGLAQGGSLSPLLLNVDLDQILDKPWRQQRDEASLLRYADDLLILNRDRKTADRDLSLLDRRLRELGTPLKASPWTTILDLTTGKAADWLGFSVRRQGNELDVETSERGWIRLDQVLEQCYDDPNPPQAALGVIQGHIYQLGPCYREDRIIPYYTKIVEIACKYDFEEIPNQDQFHNQWLRSGEQWDSVKNMIKDQWNDKFYGGSAGQTSPLTPL